ncbi:MAG: mechanosensitive ion channel family protein [Spirochaetia bacterium]|nr:mechanosensitive ion channel family protein [Spirochaetia bacterium]
MNGIQLPESLRTFFQSIGTTEFWWKTISTILTVAVILGVFRFLQMAVARTASKKFPEAKVFLARKIVKYTGYSIAAAILLKAVGINITALLGAAGIAGIAIGFAAQTSVSNLISGIFLISEKPFEMGDVIQTGDITGTVLSIDLLSIKIQTFDNRFVRIPNETIIKTNVINLTKFPIRRMDIRFQVSYNADIEKVIDTCAKIAQRNRYALDNPEPLILVDSFDNSGINILFGIWFERSQLVSLKNSIIIDIQRRFAEEHIEIPYPKMDVYIKENSGMAKG